MTRFFNRKGNRKNSNRPSLNKRRLHLESLEDRMLLAVDSFGAADAMFFGPQQTGQVIEVANTTVFALTKALQGANDGDTLVFAKAGTIKLTTPITINAAVTIDGGAGVTIDGQGNCRLFEFNANATIANMTLTGGSADEGGVACVSTDAPRRYLTFNNCQVYNNHATGGGGAFQTNNGTITLNNCEVYSNTADHGGAAYVAWGATLVINDSVLYGNSAGFGGAIYNLYSKIYTANCTIAGNTSTEGAIMNFRLESDEYPMIEVLNNTLVVNNFSTTDSAYADIYDLYYGSDNIFGNLSLGNSIIGEAGDYFVVAPEFDANGNLTNLDTLDLSLKACSVAVNGGNNSNVAGDTDVAGNPRIYDGTVDIGAYEYQAAPSHEEYSTVVTTLEDVVDGNDGLISLREAILYAGRDGLGTTVTFDSSLKDGTMVLTNGQININKSVTIEGNGVTLDAQEDDRILYIRSLDEEDYIDVAISDMTFTNGKNGPGTHYIQAGGAIWVAQNVNITIEDCDFIDNTFSQPFDGTYISGGGAIGITFNSNVTINGCDFINNRNVVQASYEGGDLSAVKAYGGAIFNTRGSVLTINDSLFSGNAVTSEDYLNNGTYGLFEGYGGAIYNTGKDVRINNSQFIGNSVVSAASFNRGGAIFNATRVFAPEEGEGRYAFRMDNCVIRGNWCGDSNVFNGGFDQGGGIYNKGYLVLVNSLVAENELRVCDDQYGICQGAGIWNNYLFAAYNTTITHNVIMGTEVETAQGGGFFNESSEGLPTLVNCILLSNTVVDTDAGASGVTKNDAHNANEDADSFAIKGSLLYLGALKGANYLREGNTNWRNGSVVFTDEEGGDYTLPQNSIAVDTIAQDSDYYFPFYETDLRGRGYARVYNEKMDHGCYEYQPYVPTFDITVENYDGVYDAAAHTVTLVGVEAGDTVLYSADGTTYSSAAVELTDAGSATVYVKVSRSGYQDWEGTGTISIAAKQLTVVGSSVADKDYDGTTAATVTLGTVEGVCEGDVVTVEASAEFPSAAVGTYDVTITYTISGDDAANYLAPVNDVVSAKIKSTGGEQLTAPVISTVESYGANRHTVAWDAIENAVGYEIAYSTDQEAWDTISTADTLYHVTGLTYGDLVYYKVKAIGDGASYTDSEYSAAKSLYVCPMDCNGDKIISGADLTVLSKAYFSRPSSASWDARADVDGSGMVNGSDLTWLSSNWLKRPTSAGLTYPAPKAEAFADADFDALDLDLDFVTVDDADLDIF